MKKEFILKYEMFVYRIVKDSARTNDLSGTGAYRAGGRWNSKGTYMLYTSENSSLAYLETLVHFEEANFPPKLFIIKIEIKDQAPVFTLAEKDYPKEWFVLDQPENKRIGDRLMDGNKYLALKIRSAINKSEYNYLLNPLFPRFHELVSISDVVEIKVDERLV